MPPEGTAKFAYGPPESIRLSRQPYGLEHRPDLAAIPGVGLSKIISSAVTPTTPDAIGFCNDDTRREQTTQESNHN
jgi:hypothetical protein